MHREYAWRFIMKQYFKKTGRKQLILLGLLVFTGGILCLTFLFGEVWDEEQKIAITAHRGASLLAPENTISALLLAIENQADYAEIDVQETKDGVVVLLHDHSLKRTTGKRQYIWNVTYDELKKLDCGKWFSKQFAGERIPTLREALELCQDKICLNIELKGASDTRALAEKVVALVEEYDFEDRCVITSADYEALCFVKQANKKLKTGQIISRVRDTIYEKDEIDFFSMKSAFVDKAVVEEAHSFGKEVHVWTVNSQKEMERMKRLGVDNIITDNPLLARKVIAN